VINRSRLVEEKEEEEEEEEERRELQCRRNELINCRIMGIQPLRGVVFPIKAARSTLSNTSYIRPIH
jgi:hypothetical protein